MPESLAQSRDLRIDLVRGAAVVCMVQFHTVDSFASPATRAGWFGQLAVFFGGGAAPLFLTLAGLGAALGWFSKGKRALPLLQRGVEIWSIAILFRVQEWALGGEGASSTSLIRVDVLNCIGVSLLILAGLLQLSKRLPDKAVVPVMLAAAAVFIGCMPLQPPLPAPLAYYFGGPGHLSMFPIFGWTGMACIGAAFGAAMHLGVRHLPASALAIYGLIVAARLVFPEALHFAPLNDNVVFTLERTALSLGLIAVAHLFPLQRVLLLLGNHSLLIYWVHVELVYGLWFHSKKGTLAPFAMTCAVLAMLLAMWLMSLTRRRLSYR